MVARDPGGDSVDEPNVEPELRIPLGSWQRRRARVLEPGNAVRVPGQPRVHQTAYVSDALLVRAGLSATARNALREAAKSVGYHVGTDPQAKADRAWLSRLDLSEPQRKQIHRRWIERVRLVPHREHQGLMSPEDAWHVLQTYRNALGPKHRETLAVGLEHLVSATWPPDLDGTPLTSSHGIGGVPLTSSHGVSPYAVPGTGGRQPVRWVGPAPSGDPDLAAHVRRPVVAVLDTGVAEHPWLDGHVRRGLEVEGMTLDVAPSVPDSEEAGWTDQLIQLLDPNAGHGTFIAGLIRQACPDATVLAIRLFHGDGIVGEWDLLRSLQLLTVRHALAVNGDSRYDVVDIVSLSLGYYHEQPEDRAYSALLRDWLDLLGRWGVTVVTAAGNDATLRPMYPGAFAPWSDDEDDPGRVPVVCVGAENPDGSIALFSNEGRWVRYLRPGASLVSTYPLVDASLTPAAEIRRTAGVRSSIDPDDFTAGFAVWSGTSFAAPVFAGEMAAELLRLYKRGRDSTGFAAARNRARKVLESMPPASRPTAEGSTT